MGSARSRPVAPGDRAGRGPVPDPREPPGRHPPAGNARVVRAAGPDDLERVRRLAAEREVRFAACRRVFQDGLWPIDLIDVEPLLDDGRTVLYYLGLHRLDVAGILAAFRASTDLDVMLEPVGRDLAEDEADPPGPPTTTTTTVAAAAGLKAAAAGRAGAAAGLPTTAARLAGSRSSSSDADTPSPLPFTPHIPSGLFKPAVPPRQRPGQKYSAPATIW